MRLRNKLILLAVAVSSHASAALAADIPIDNPAWRRLSAAQKVALERRLRAGGALGIDDRLVSGGGSTDFSGSTEENVVVSPSTLAQIAAQVCKRKNLAELEKCAAQPADMRAACREKEKARYNNTKVACK
jgi:hypothetical protein